MDTAAYTERYNGITLSTGLATAGADTFRIPRELLDECGYDDNLSVLDYGCGWGSLLTVIDPKEYLGVDISPFMVDAAKDKNPGRLFQVNKIGEPIDSSFDFIVAHSVFTHVPKDIVDVALGDIRNCISSDGAAIIDIFYGERGEYDICEFYGHEEWLSLLQNNRLLGEHIGTQDREGFYTHYYYKVTRL